MNTCSQIHWWSFTLGVKSFIKIVDSVSCVLVNRLADLNSILIRERLCRSSSFAVSLVNRRDSQFIEVPSHTRVFKSLRGGIYIVRAECYWIGRGRKHGSNVVNIEIMRALVDEEGACENTLKIKYRCRLNIDVDFILACSLKPACCEPAHSFSRRPPVAREECYTISMCFVNILKYFSGATCAGSEKNCAIIDSNKSPCRLFVAERIFHVKGIKGAGQRRAA